MKCDRCDGTGWIDPHWPVGPGGARLSGHPCTACDGTGEVIHRGEVMNPPASAAEGAEAGNLSTPQRSGSGADPQGMEAQATQPSAAPSEAPGARPSDERNGCFVDSFWCCKVCDGEIPDGHLENCDIWKLEKKHRNFIANEYNSVLKERDESRDRATDLHGALVRVVLEGEGCGPHCSHEFHQTAIASILRIAKNALRRLRPPQDAKHE